MLARQIKRLKMELGQEAPTPAQWQRFLERIDRTYTQSDEDRYLLERSLELSSGEMRQMYEELQRRSAGQLSREKSRLGSVLQALDDGLCTLDSSGQCLSLNARACEYLNATEEHLKGRDVGIFFQLGEHGRMSFSKLWMRLQVGETLRFDDALLLAPGVPARAVSCILSPLREGSRVTGCVFVFRDITALMSAHDELERLNNELTTARDDALDASKSKSRFLANMSHELRTPLNAIIGYSELLVEDIDESGDALLRGDITRINIAAHHLLQLIDDVLDISKIEAGEMTLHLEDFDVRELVEELQATVAPLIVRHENELNVVMDIDDGRMRSDKLKLRQMLLNLISNAAKFTHEGEITLAIKRTSTRTLFSVTDDGVGIPADKLEALFEEFKQVDQAQTIDTKGTGLGLAITRHMTTLLGGDLDVSSTEGLGSTFTITIPHSPPTP